jgi:hypothetical protein
MAEVISASYITLAHPRAGALGVLVHQDASSSWSRLPQLTPMRTGLFQRIAASIIWPNWRSRLSPLPTLPGLMRYLDSAWRRPDSRSAAVAVVVEVADQRHVDAHAIELLADVGHLRPPLPAC